MLKLEGLSLNGFKSFADRTEVLFPDGITCVVGPNGCGKSNILDAIAWVLGEQSARHLRGSKMEEVIFAGTRSRKPAGLAEVTLRFAPRSRGAAMPDDAAMLSPGAASALLEGDGDPRLLEPLAITRRLYRNGDSEYLINDQRARLKDIVQLIMGTGMGTRVYSIIEQGRVDQILNSKPTDRRVLIEEAAGVTRYKARRRAAKLKLDESEQSLLRVSDIVGELEKQLRSLKRQVGTARRYRRLAGRRRVVLRGLHAVKNRVLTGRLEAIDRDLAQLSASATESFDALAALEDATREARERVAEIEARRDTVQQASHGIHLEIERSRHVVESSRQRQRDLDERGRRASDAGRAAEGERQEMQVAVTELGERLARLDEELAAARGKLDACATGTRAVRERLSATHREIAETKESIFEAMSEAAGLRNRKQEVEAAVARMELQVQRLTERRGELEVEVERAAAALANGDMALRVAAAEEERLAGELAAVLSRIQGTAARAAELRTAHEEARASLHDGEWRLSALAETIRSRASYAEGVRRLLADTPAGVLGAVADFVTVREGDELASEKALGHFLQAVVVESRDAAERIARGLAEGQQAEVHFVFPGSGEAADEAPQPADRKISGPLSDALSFGTGDTAWLARLVPQGWLVATAKDALALSRKFPESLFVSRDGVLMGPGGHGSSGRPLGEGDGILETRNRHARLDAEVATRRATMLARETELQLLEAEREALAADRERLKEELSSAEKTALAARHEAGGLRQSLDGSESRLLATRLEHESHATELQHASERLTDLALRLAAASTQRTDLERQLAKAQELAGRLEADVEGADTELSRLREEVAVKAERRDSGRLEHARAQAELARRAAQARELAAQAEALDAERQETEALIARTEEAIAAGSERWESLRAELEQAEAGVRSGRTGLLEGAERLRDMRLEHERRARLATESEVRRERISAELEHGISDCREKLGVEPHELPVPEPPAAPIAVAEEAVKPKRRRRGVVAEEAAIEADAATMEPDSELVAEAVAVADGEDESEESAVVDETLPWVDGVLDLPALETEAEELRVRLDRIGPVNLVAIEEYDELAARHGFLTKEQADLVEAIRSLRSTIDEIDHLSRDRFNEAFEEIRLSFDRAFQTLFRGGRAELRLQDDDDPLECGIEIIAQPPGKRLQNMLLLSGGEKALTAIALLFALFRYKPSPFCVLDEVDAPLDESNVLRFLDLVAEMAKETQFVLITHDRRSMERGNVLYGVTMQEPGCSKLVGVQFEGLGASESAA